MADQQFQHHQIYIQSPQCYQPSYAVPQQQQQSVVTTTNDTLIQLRTLQEQLNSLQQQRDQLQKELNSEKQKSLQMQQQLQAQQQLSLQMQQQYETQLRTLQFELAKYKQAQSSQEALMQVQQQQHPQTQQVHATYGLSSPSVNSLSNKSVGKLNGEHICEACQFKTKSEVSLLLHKVNHGLIQKHLQLPTTIFTTKNNNSSNTFLYKCPACDSSFARHEVYSHIYQYHTTEQPHHCGECDLFFTHLDYLTEHQRDKHKSRKRKSDTGNKRSKSSAWNSLETIISTTIGSFDEGNASSLSIPNTPSINKGTANSITPKQQLQPVAVEIQKGDFKCTFAECGFATNTKERLEFHMSAHKNSKFKCPYCPYVGNILIDIRRHIQKSPRHQGVVVFSCQKCDYGTNCEKTFKDHLRQSHFGREVTDKMIASFIDDMFSNTTSQS